MKRLLALVLALLMLFLASACSDASSKNQGPTSVQTDSYYAYFSNKEYPYGYTEKNLSDEMCGQTPRQVYYSSMGIEPPENINVKVGEEQTLTFWTFPHHTFCGGYEFIIEDVSVLKIASSDWGGMYDEPLHKALPDYVVVEGVSPGKTTLTYKITSAEGTESVTLNITVVE